jgi:hypothetical protein
VSVPVQALFPERVASEDALADLLRLMKRDDVLLQCAYANALISGFDPAFGEDRRQAAAIRALCAPGDIARINALPRPIGRGTPNIFFRGQLLQLMRMAAQSCDSAPGTGADFVDPEARSRFLAAALIAGDLWNRRIYADRLSSEQDIEEARKRALGAFRKAMDESNSPSHLGICLGRGRALFGEYLPRELPEFEALFQADTGLSYEQYAVAATALATYTFAGRSEGCVFNPKTVGSATRFHPQIDAFLRVASQTSGELGQSLSETFKTQGYRAIRDRPILSLADGRAVVLDAQMFYEKIAVGPLFHAVNGTKKLKHVGSLGVFGAFGDAFERYAEDTLKRMHPKGLGLVDRVWFGAQGKTAKGDAFQVDAHMVEPIGEALAAIIIEAKAVFLPEEAILDDPDIFLDELRRRYGKDPGGVGRDKGVAQLARIVRAILERSWRGQDCELAKARVIVPVLLTHDTRMDSPIFCWQLNEDLLRLIDDIPLGWRVLPLILLTIADLENLESSVGQFTLAELFRDYDDAAPDRMISFERFLISSKYRALIKPSGALMAHADAQMETVVQTLFPKQPLPDAV